MSEYWILVVLLFLQAVMRLFKTFNWQKANGNVPFIWKIQLFIFPIIFLLGVLLELIGIHLVGYIAVIGLLFEFTSAIIKQFTMSRIKKKSSV